MIEIRRHKTDDELSIDDLLERDRARRTGKSWEPPETDEYRAARNKALEKAGLEPDRDIATTDLEEMSIEDHIERKRNQ